MSQGEAFIQLCDFQSAADSYNQANFLDPGAFDARLSFIYNMQVKRPALFIQNSYKYDI